MNHRLHILWINEEASFVGGCEHYIYNTIQFLSKLGVRSSLLYNVNQPAAPRFLKAFDSAFPMVNIRYQIEEINPDIIYIHNLSDQELLKEFKDTNKPTVRFFHDHKLFCLREHKYTTLGHRTCTKTVGLSCYSCLGFLNKKGKDSKYMIKTVGALLREQAQNKALDAFVVGSRYMAEHVAAHGFPREKISVVPLYSLPPVVKTEVSREKDLLVFVGQLVRGKGVDILLDAMSKTKTRPRLLLIGTGKQEQVYRRQCKELNLEDRVTFVGKVSPEQTAIYYQQATCVVMPSRIETFGLVGTEAMSYGTPVIASDVGGITEWLEHERTGLTVPSNDSTALSEAIDRLIGDPKFCQSLGINAQKSYYERFMPDNHVNNLYRLFTSLAGKEAYVS